MTDIFSHLAPDEIEIRRQKSIAVMEERERKEFDLWYQEKCDRLYWTQGRCCAGCDHWHSDMGFSGTCDANGIVPGIDVLKSVGIICSSYIPAPGLPFTRAEFVCGKFQDDFDWQSLDREYLEKIEAIHFGKLKSKPVHNIITKGTNP